MKCWKCFRDLTAYLEGTLGPEAQAGVERHLDECKECRGFAEFLRDNYFLAAEEYRVEPAPFFFTRVKARLESVTATTANSSWRVLLQPTFFSLLLLLGIYSGIRLGSTTVNNRVYGKPKAHGNKNQPKVNAIVRRAEAIRQLPPQPEDHPDAIDVSQPLPDRLAEAATLILGGRR